MKLLFGIGLLIAAPAAQARHWVPIATGPDVDPTGLYVDRDSLKGTYPVKSIREKFVNSYREEKLSLVEFNCDRHSWRTFSFTLHSPNGSVLQNAKFPNPKSSPIVPGSPQDAVRRLVCKSASEKVTRKTIGLKGR